jgi:hypothetical protein
MSQARFAAETEDVSVVIFELANAGAVMLALAAIVRVVQDA